MACLKCANCWNNYKIPFIALGIISKNLISNFIMENLEKITNFILAVGTVLTAAASIYKQYNEDKKKINDCVQIKNDTV